MPLMLLGLIPLIPHLVMGCEILFKHGSGAAKKQAALAMASDALNIFASAAGTPGADSSHMAFIDDLIEATVKFFNSNGTFTHASLTNSNSAIQGQGQGD